MNNPHKNRQAELTIRAATENDVPRVLEYIKKLAVYEKMVDEVVATETLLHQSLFVHKAAEVLLGEVNGTPVGFALFFQTFSTFVGTPNVFLEDLFIDEGHRGQGYGKALLREVAKAAHARGAKRLEWVCLNWNAEAIAFYTLIGAKPMDEWTLFRLEGGAIRNFIRS